MPSSPKKNSITSWDEYYELYELWKDAKERLNPNFTGGGYSGIHFQVAHVLGRFGIHGMGREDAVRELKKLLNAFEKEHKISETGDDDEEFLNRFDNVDDR